MYVSRSAKTSTKGQKFGLYGYEPLGDSQDGRLGSPVFNPFDGVTLGSIPANQIEAAQQAVAEAGAEIAQASGKMAYNPTEGQKELVAAQAKLAQATARLAALQQEASEAKAASKDAMPIQVLVALIALAGLGGYFFFLRRR